MQFFNFLFKKTKAFTLIELIITCSIIIILVSTTLVSLNSAKDKAKDARIVEDMRQMLNLAQREINKTGGHIRSWPAEFNGFVEDIKKNGGKTRSGGDGVSIFTDLSNGIVTNFCATTKLNSGDWWCIDSDLTSKKFKENDTNFICGTGNPVILTCE